MLYLPLLSYTVLAIILLRVTPTAKRNSYRVAILVGALTQGSVLRPQPWAGETQLCQSCQGCAPFSDVYGQIYLGGNGLTMMDDMHPMVEWCVVRIQ